jgi:hypothetical protein
VLVDTVLVMVVQSLVFRSLQGGNVVKTINCASPPTGVTGGAFGASTNFDPNRLLE